ncbi:MAG: beta-ketoacyl-[acyl-carrier-protein] synthase family protein, partial [Leptospiraceae bacterium]|nr:beta-ketoacyl-[acyl-carrier-protein] synthase family protein [Leptospiraceae bacterium]
LAGFGALKALSTKNDQPKKASRPWDTQRDGFVIGEGAGILVLETLEHALKRNAPIYAEYLGGSANCDAYHITSPKLDGSGIEECIRLALKDAEIEPNQINYINAHATSTDSGDRTEILGIKRVFKEQASQIHINATKSIIGHSLGAAGGLEAITTVLAIATKQIHPTINLENPEEFIQDMNVTTQAKEVDITAALTNSFGFGGHNSSLIFAPYK